jgi:hypothetical protein
MSLRKIEGALPRVPRRRSTLAVLAGTAIAGILVSGVSLSSALAPTAIVNTDRTYDCDLNYGNQFFTKLYAGDTLTVTVAGTACDSMTFTIGTMFDGTAPTVTKNGNPIAASVSTPVASGDVFVLTEQLGNGYGDVSFTNASSFTWSYPWEGDASNVPTSSTTATTPTTTPSTAPTTTPNGSAQVGDIAAGDPVAPAFTG